MGEISKEQQDMVQDILASYHNAMREQGIHETYLAKKLKRELNAKETKVFNPKGNSKPEGLIYSKPLVSWDIRQKARMDAQKILGLYAPNKIDITDTRMMQLFLDALPDDLRAAVEGEVKERAAKEAKSK
jgi:hypothetical protein